MQTTQTTHPIFTFADGELGPISNTLIRSIERFSGQPKIRKLYFDYVEEDRPHAGFWSDALDKLDIDIDLRREAGAIIPRSGPTLVVANHPYGVIDGLVLCALMAEIRSDYKIITHRVLKQAPATMDKILPIDFDETETALATNIETRQEAAAYLRAAWKRREFCPSNRKGTVTVSDCVASFAAKVFHSLSKASPTSFGASEMAPAGKMITAPPSRR